MASHFRSSPAAPSSLPPLEAIRLEGFKSFRDRTEVAIKPLTLLAGRNSAGKSSLMQPLLLMKQTLEAPYEVHPFLWDGPCVRVSQASSLAWVGATFSSDWMFGVGSEGKWVDVCIGNALGSFRVKRQVFTWPSGHEVVVYNDDSSLSVSGVFPDDESDVLSYMYMVFEQPGGLRANCRVLEKRSDDDEFGWEVTERWEVEQFECIDIDMYNCLIHLPGLRGNPERAYPTTRVSHRFPGTFTPYTASVLAVWREQGDPRLEQVQEDLRRLGLSGAVEAKRLDDTRVELRVGRRLQDSHASVNIADVGFGVSQVMPVVVALRAALPGQTVHIEQPELHLHPNAQVAMAELLLDAARRGVRVIAETHSAVLLKAVQVAVAEGRAEPELVALHWFDRDEEGATKVTTAELDSEGAYGAWPVDFADVELDIERRFIMAPFKKGEEG